MGVGARESVYPGVRRGKLCRVRYRFRMQNIPPHKNTKSAEHHYFPRAIQRFWRDADGWVHRLSSTGQQKTSKNGSFGHIRNAHHVKLADKPTVWDETFEHTFQKADTAFPALITSLLGLEFGDPLSEAPWRDRLRPVRGLNGRRPALAECVASLVVRSPSVRNLIRVGVASFGVAPDPDKLIAVNQKTLLGRYTPALREGGKFLIARASGNEFIFGDGCLNNFHVGGAVTPHNPRCVIALTPDLAIIYDSPMSYMSNDKICSVVLAKDEVDLINEMTMVYSKQYIYYRNHVPVDLEDLRLDAHRQFQYHNTPWLSDLLKALADAWFPP